MKLGRVMIGAALIGAAVALASWAFPTRILWEKVATMLVAPVGLLWLLLGTMLLVALVQRQKSIASLALMAWLLLSVTGNLYVARWLMFSLERDYVNLQPLEALPLSTIVVLGGGTASNYLGAAQLDVAGDRIMMAARLYEAGLAKQIICTGGHIQGLDAGTCRPQGELARELLQQLGVPPDQVQAVGGRTTTEEMRELRQLLAGESQIGLVTSASHMQRALRLASGAGLEFVPLPCDVAARNQRYPIPIDFIPTGYALELSARAGKEHLAALVGR